MRPGWLWLGAVGDVEARAVRAIEETIADCYGRLTLPPPPPLEVRVVDTVERMAALMAAEKALLGIATTGDEGFACTHDAFADRPRITVCLESFGDPNAPPNRAALRHEVGHAVLHGRREFYEARATADQVRAGRGRGLEGAAFVQLLFFLAVAVKDWQVNRLLLARGYAEDVQTLAWQILAPSDEDRAAWEFSQGRPPLRLLWAAAQLKPLLAASPLAAVPGLAPRVEARARAMLSYLPEALRERLLALAQGLDALLGEDTHANIATAISLLLTEGF